MEGYGKIAERMATLPSLAIFRQFQALRAQNLLYMQAELVELENRFQDQAARDTRSPKANEKLYSRDWLTLSSLDDRGEHSEQWKLALQIRDKLEAYERALLRHNDISSTLPKPTKQALDLLASIMDNPRLSDYLSGLDHSVWKDADSRRDLISVNPDPDFDVVTQWLIKLFLGPYHWLFGTHLKENVNADADIFHYDDQHLKIPARIITTLVASLLPSLAIVVLYIVDNMARRLGLIAGFTAVFAVVLAGLTEARTVDIFAATAAFAAVQVVFIGTNTSDCSGCN